MSTSRSLQTALTPRRVASAVTVLVGIGLASYGGYTQYTIARALADGACNGCSPWHPLFVVAPLFGGVLLVAAGSYSFARTTC